MNKKRVRATTTAAIHVDSGVTIKAVDVDPGNRQGPWECPDDNCQLELSHVRRQPSYAQSGPVKPASNYFRRKRPLSEHDDQCDAYTAAKPRKLQVGKKPKRSEIFLLTVGPPAPPVEITGGETRERTTRAPEEDYAGHIGSLKVWLKTIERQGSAENMRFFWHRHHGVNYQWDQLSYEANYEDYKRLKREVASLVNPAKERPWLIQGVCQSAPKQAQNKRFFLVIGAYESAPVPKVRAFFPMTPEMITATETIVSGTRVAVLLSGGATAERADGFTGDLISPSDLVVLK